MLHSPTSNPPRERAQRAAPRRPLLPAHVTAPDPNALAAIRRFHLLGVDDDLPEVDGQLWPALLSSFRGAPALRTDYPLVLAPEGAALATPFAEAVEPSLLGGGILHDNLARWHQAVIEALGAGIPKPAAAVLTEAADSMLSALRLAAPHAATVRAEVARVCAALGEDAELLPYGPDVAWILFTRGAERIAGPVGGRVDARLEGLIRRLGELLEIERRKDDAARRPEAVQLGAGTLAQGLFDPRAMSGVLGTHRGPVRMNPARRERLESVLGQLRAWRASEPARPVILHGGALDHAVEAYGDRCRFERAEDPATQVVARFDAEAKVWQERFRALRIAELELEGQWDEARHAPWMESFEWRTFSAEELQCMPPIVALLGADALANEALLPASSALTSGRPVKLLAFARPADDLRSGPEVGYRLDLSFFGLGHREAFVMQGSTARPAPLASAFEQGLAAPRAGLFVMSSDAPADGTQYAVGRWLAASAAVEARAHPLFTYAPDAGETWADRIHVDGNPDLEQAWVRHDLECQDQGGAPQTRNLAFTFADYALLDPEHWRSFRRAPADCPLDDLSEMDAWLELPEAEASHKIPFVWAADEQSNLHRVVVGRTLAWRCRDRQRAWGMLRELGGVKNPHVEAALAKARATAEAELEAALAARDAEHAAALEETEKTAARAAMQRLTAVLLDMDAGPIAPGAPSPAAAPRPAPAATPAPVEAVEAAPAEAPPAPAPVDDDDDDEEPWVDSPLCTSCNDCVNLNAQLFVYDANKQVKIGDPRGGSYLDLVTAAELCPSKCIHPGSPLNPDEPDLAELRERARKFN